MMRVWQALAIGVGEENADKRGAKGLGHCSAMAGESSLGPGTMALSLTGCITYSSLTIMKC